MRSLAALTAIFAFAISASVAWPEITAEQVSGKTMQDSRKNTFTMGTDGTLVGTTSKGDAVSGTWEVKDGKWCRTIKEPARLAGSACQAATIKGDTLTLTVKDGAKLSFTLK